MQQQLQPILNQLTTVQQQMMTLSQGGPDPYGSTRDLQAATASINQATTLIQGILSQPGT